MDVILFNKDNTLGEFYSDGCGLYENTTVFMQDQKLRRKLCIATTSPDEHFLERECLTQLIDSYYYDTLKIGILVKDFSLIIDRISEDLSISNENLRIVHVGNHGDTDFASTYSKMPLVVISNRVKLGEWGLVEKVLDLLFYDENIKPWEAYDNLTDKNKDKGKIYIDESEYAFDRRNNTARILYCPK